MATEWSARMSRAFPTAFRNPSFRLHLRHLFMAPCVNCTRTHMFILRITAEAHQASVWSTILIWISNLRPHVRKKHNVALAAHTHHPLVLLCFFDPRAKGRKREREREREKERERERERKCVRVSICLKRMRPPVALGSSLRRKSSLSLPPLCPRVKTTLATRALGTGFGACLGTGFGAGFVYFVFCL